MMFEYALDASADGYSLHGIAEQIAHHAHASGVRQFYQNGNIWSVLTQRIVGRAPDALPTEDAPARRDRNPFKLE